MINFRSCPKCITGAIYEHIGLDGPEKKCISCAYIQYETVLELSSSKTERESLKLAPSA